MPGTKPSPLCVPVHPDDTRPDAIGRARARAPRAWLACVGSVGLALALLGMGCGGDIETRMAEVRALQDVGQFTASIDELREILAVAPDLPEANYRLGIALVQTGEPTRAVWALQKASESPDYAIVAGLMLASAHYSIQNHEDALRAADRVLELDPERMTALTIRAQANLGALRLEEARADAERLIELFPDDYRSRVIHATVLMDLARNDESLMDEAKAANDLVKETGLASGDPEIENRACLAPAYFAKDQLGDNERAEELYEDCLARFPHDAFVVSQAMSFFDEIGKPERSTQLIRGSVENAPENLSLRSQLASRLARQGDAEAAEKVLVEAVESFGSAAAWNQLAAFYRSQDDPEKALEALEKVTELTGGGSDQLRFTLADVLVDVGDLDRAEEVAKSMNEPTYARLIRGRILLARDDPAAALESFEQGIRRWPNNPGARYLAGLAAYELGDFDRAVSELREAVRADLAATEAALLLARLHFERGEYQQAVSFSSAYLKKPDRPQRAEAYILGIRAFAAQGEYDRARRSVETFRSGTSEVVAPTVELASVERAASGPEAAVAVIRDSGLDLSAPECEPALRSYVDSLLALDRAEEARPAVAAALEARPEAASLHELQGLLLARSGDAAEARRAFERAVELDPENAQALGGLATLAAREGDFGGAIETFDRAASVSKGDPKYAYSAAQLTLQSGRKDEAIQRLRAIIASSPGHAGARNDLAWLLTEQGQDLDTALRLAEEARRLDPASPEILDTLGYVHLKRGEASAAVEALEVAVETSADSPSIRYRLATALTKAGDQERAREMLRIALASGSFPEAEAARRELAALERP